MKNLIWLKKTVLILALVSVTVACEDNDDPVVSGTTITQLAAADPNLTSLVAALIAADGNLPQVLQGPGPFTVLAPTNEAFDDFLQELGVPLNQVPSAVLTQVLLNHVITGKVEAADLIALNAQGNFYASTNAVGAKEDTFMSIYFDTDGGVAFNGVSNVIEGGADIQASNGVIHKVDAVIGLPTIVTFALADDRFETLVAALTRESSFTFVTALSTANGTDPAPFTVFAPTNNAFANLLTALDAPNLAAIPTATLQTVLAYHVLDGRNVLSSDLEGLDGVAVPSLGGTNITVQASPAGIIGPDQTVNPIIIADVQASNGVIHAISRVIR